MSMLRERLLRQKSAGGVAKSAAVTDPTPQTAEWGAIGAHMEHNEWGSFVMRRRCVESQTLHGCYMLSELAGQADKLLALLAPARSYADGEDVSVDGGLLHEQLLYLDTETTGLGIGAGNVAFMIGIGFYEGERFIVEQMFIRDPGEELGMLYYLQQKIAKHPYLVTYNGKTFDWPIIKNRYILNRMPSEIPIAGHFDFLYPSRSLWKHTLPSCRLGKVEEERLGVVRTDDVPGSLAPALYFQYLAERDVSIVEGVFVHNELDILSLASLSVHFTNILNGKSSLSAMGLEELYRLGVWLAKLGQDLLAAQALERLAERIMGLESVTEEGADDYLLPLAQVYKQQHRFAEARGLWELYAERKGDRITASLEPYIELSMHYEHRDKQLRLALTYASQALDKAWRQQSLKRSFGGDNGTGTRTAGKQNEIADLEKRIQRLRLKVERLQRVCSSLTSSKKPGTKHRSRSSAVVLEHVMDSLI
jgi:uncharacterized protein YprB with RNaseH-like and TPR domain